MPRHALPVAIITIAVVATIATGYVYLGPFFKANSSVRPSTNPSVTVISIPEGAHIYPAGFNVTQLLTNTYRYPFNVTVTIGVDNTILWMNNDTFEHTVAAFIVPTGGQMFDSGLILPGKTFSATLTVSGVYRYTCSWHPWLAGQITVKPA
jgi:hypothetical protein